MKKRTKRWMAVLCACTTALALSACQKAAGGEAAGAETASAEAGTQAPLESGSTAATDAGAPETESAAPAGEAKKIILGSTGVLAKWTQTAEGSAENGGLEGYDIDVWNEIARRNNFELEWKVAEFQALFGMLDNGDITTIANEVTTNPERLEKYDFTDTYAYDGYVFVVKKGSAPDSLDWFKNKKICVEAATNPRLVLEDMNEEKAMGIEIGYLDTQSVLLPAVDNGTYDGAFMIKTAAQIGIDDLGMDLEQFDPQYKVLPICYPLTRTDENAVLKETINATLKEMKEDGTLAELSNKWFGQDVTVEPAK
ncbi:transporter substrate-binding domain-containing protein [Enterocloster lavalensis]|uniref:transporter substrate-binding domain-containing protein n=1 Tax=Enterocloster lavalensis TaxID=460384 RepID=UPI00266500B2|nr:transporter substrate-binding domain-containing protein [Enterocloster lavalensis]